jgi:hypothetical protein
LLQLSLIGGGELVTRQVGILDLFIVAGMSALVRAQQRVLVPWHDRRLLGHRVIRSSGQGLLPLNHRFFVLVDLLWLWLGLWLSSWFISIRVILCRLDALWLLQRQNTLQRLFNRLQLDLLWRLHQPPDARDLLVRKAPLHLQSLPLNPVDQLRFNFSHLFHLLQVALDRLLGILQLASILRPDHDLFLMPLLYFLFAFDRLGADAVCQHSLQLFFFHAGLFLQKLFSGIVLTFQGKNFSLFHCLVLSFGLHFLAAFIRSPILDMLVLRNLKLFKFSTFLVIDNRVTLVSTSNQRKSGLVPDVLRGLRSHEALLSAQQRQPVLELLQLLVRFFLVQV